MMKLVNALEMQYLSELDPVILVLDTGVNEEIPRQTAIHYPEASVPTMNIVSAQ